MSVTTKTIVLVLMLLAAACTTFSQREPQLEIPAQTVDAETPLDPETEFEEAKRECAEKGGEWIGYIHGDGSEFHFYRMRCLSQNDLPRRAGDGRWEKPRLLPYDIDVSYSNATQNVIRFSRFEPDSEEKLNNGDQETNDQQE